MSGLPKYKFDKDNLKLICDDLQFVNWFNIFDTNDLEQVWSDFINTIFNLWINMQYKLIKSQLLPGTNPIQSLSKAFCLERAFYGKLGKQINHMCSRENIKKFPVNVD